MNIQQTWSISKNEINAVKIKARLHLSLEVNDMYISFYIPETPDISSPETFMINEVSEILKWPSNLVGIQGGVGGEMKNACELIFTGQIYIYSERPVLEAEKTRLTAESSAAGYKLTFRSLEYMSERDKLEKPLAFISHDWRDKSEIAEPLAVHLQKLLCPVWYDQFTLRVGDSLRESIEKRLKECRKCIVVLTPNFLSNSGWSKREYDSIFTRELIEKQEVILPIWHDVSPEQIYQYSPILADRVAAQWSKGVEEVANQLLQAINVVQ